MNIIFGGSGFIGKNLIKQINAEYQVYDIVKSDKNFNYCDVRMGIKISSNFDPNCIIYNLAALCTIPKYKDSEYFDTNVNGALNICNFAREKNIKTIIFLSSISTYGVKENYVSEENLPMPNNAYGISKLIAEQVHLNWQAEDSDNRRLIIIRPGIVFGKNENGNFTRLYKAMSRGVFFFPGRNDTKKATIYVKDLIKIMLASNKIFEKNPIIINACYPSPHRIRDICLSISKVTSVRAPKIVIPGFILKFLGFLFFTLGKFLKREFLGIHPDRIHKLMISTNVSGKKLEQYYKLQFTMDEAISDWFNECGQKGLF
tara:strand:- start:377 stop:1324 length:948 start_codon:yes stop_codon:yes gene_type:complete